MRVKKQIKFALIGCGRIAHRHAAVMQSHGIIQAVCDIDSFKADTFAKQFNARSYHDLQDLLKAEKEIDLVAICTPNGLHASQSILCLQHQLHVLCEKPMALSVQDCKAMMAAADQFHKLLFIVKQNRYNPPVMAVKELLDNQMLGKISGIQLNCFWHRGADYYHQSWKGSKALDGGILYTQFSHFIDLLYWFAGEIKSVKSISKNFNHSSLIEFEDTCVAIATFQSGAVGTLHFTINSYEKNMEGSLTLFGDKGTVKIGGQYLNELEYQQISGHKISGLPAGNPPNEYGNYTGSMSNHDKVYERVCAALMQEGMVVTNSFESMKTIEMIEQIYDASI
ncbi:MAG: Gfo/Idh/MocA family oxidoreductase [Bacteroidetes bacterium]|nr:Gfo/Idh/MocA family oxidoreductase [Bacteroidota bacterium]